MPLAPHSSANAAKSGLWSDVCQTSYSTARCSFEILPSSWLSMSTWVMFIPYFTAVVSSMAYCPKPPSPLTEMTGRPDPSACTAAQQPMAAGRPKPIEPR